MQEKSNSDNLGYNYIICSWEPSSSDPPAVVWSSSDELSSWCVPQKDFAMDHVSAPDMVLSASTIIYDLVIDCLNLLRNFPAKTSMVASTSELKLRKTPMIPPWLLTRLEAIRILQKHFEIRTSYAGAVAGEPDLSLDTRLSLDWKTRWMVVGLLHSIEISLQQCIYASI